MQLSKTLKPLNISIYMTSMETALKFMNVIGLFAIKKLENLLLLKSQCDWIISFQVPQFK